MTRESRDRDGKAGKTKGSLLKIREKEDKMNWMKKRISWNERRIACNL